MAMINCPECGKQISDKAAACPNCGCPIATMKDEKVVKIKLSREARFEIYVMDCRTGKTVARGRSQQTVSFEIDAPTQVIIGGEEMERDPDKYINKATTIHQLLYPHLSVEPGKKYEYYEIAQGFFGNKITYTLREVDVIDTF